MLASLALWLSIMAVVAFCTRGEKPLSDRAADSLNRQSAYALKRRD